MNRKRQGPVGLSTLMQGQEVRRAVKDEQTWYAAIDVVGLLTDAGQAEAVWNAIKDREPQVRELVRPIEFATVEGRPEAREGVTLEGMLRVIESIASPRAQRLKAWIARSAHEHLREAENPELLAIRARKLYEQKGYSRRWVDKRLRGISARHELTGEWYQRGATESDDFRTLTNRLMQGAFGMDVENYRRYKNLGGSNQNLRDHMSDLELALTTLGETAAVALHQARNSQGREQLEVDAAEAGQIVAQTRQQIEQRSGRSVVHPGNHLAGSSHGADAGPSKGAERRRSKGGSHRRAELADKAGDMHNPSTARRARTVA